MVKYVDTGADTGGDSKKKNSRKGFKADRLENYKRMLAKKNGKIVKDTPVRTARPKTLTFDDSARRDYLLTLHKKKNERRVQAFVDMKRKLRKDSAKTRRGQREEARRAYNNYARIPILPDYTYRLPDQVDEGFTQEEDDADEDAEYLGSDQEGEEHDHSHDQKSDEDGESMPWMSVDDPDEAAADAERRLAEAEANTRRRRQAKRLATQAHSAHAMPSTMLGVVDEEVNTEEAKKKSLGKGNQQRGGTATTGRSSKVADADAEYVTVEVKPLFARPSSTTSAVDTEEGCITAGRRGSRASASPSTASGAAPLPSNNFDDLPLVVQQELRRLRQETKGPAKTKPRLRMMKELEKIRKIRKHSRKGHGKRTASGKRKNRKK